MSYYADLNEIGRRKLLKLTKTQQQELVNAYARAGRILVNKINSSGKYVEKAYYSAYLKKITAEMEAVITKYSLEGAKVPLEVQQLFMSEEFKKLDNTEFFLNALKKTVGANGIKAMEKVVGGSIYQDGKNLSKRIWKCAKQASNDVQQVINACMAQNMGAAEMSKLLEQFVDPNVRTQWGKDKIREILGNGYAKRFDELEYNALRLARTTLTHSAQTAMQEAKKVNPYCEMVRWHSVHAIGRTCQLCKDRDGQLYKVEEMPYDHPNGLCYQTFEFSKSLNQIADELKAWNEGGSNPMLDDWYNNLET